MDTETLAGNTAENEQKTASFVFVLAVSEPRLGRHQRKSVTTCDFAVPSVLNGCARHMHKVTLATERRHCLEVTQRKADQNASRICMAV